MHRPSSCGEKKAQPKELLCLSAHTHVRVSSTLFPHSLIVNTDSKYERNGNTLRMSSLLFLQHVDGDAPGLLSQILVQYGLDYQVLLVGKDLLPLTLSRETRALVVLGGPQYAGDRDDPVLIHERQLIAEALHTHRPYLGICLGAQLLAAVCGAAMQRAAATEIGFYEVERTAQGMDDPLYAGLPHRRLVFHWHHDTFELPPDAVLLEQGDTVKHQAFRVGFHAYGLQYHVELTQDMFTTWLHQHPEKHMAQALLGPEHYRQLERESQQQFHGYAHDTQLLFTNFLQISGLLTPC